MSSRNLPTPMAVAEVAGGVSAPAGVPAAALCGVVLAAPSPASTWAAAAPAGAPAAARPPTPPAGLAPVPVRPDMAPADLAPAPARPVMGRVLAGSAAPDLAASAVLGQAPVRPRPATA